MQMYTFFCHDSIDSEHNLKVVGWVAEEVPSGNNYCRADVKSEFALACTCMYSVATCMFIFRLFIHRGSTDIPQNPGQMSEGD